ncbi:hypothetical protein B0I72DRAFT_137795 [Yarrowia lipolytica]|jgi:hypothetical protein|uniref:YALI0C07634p n=2 Tax=Yarrowia lipolytica TaxID=4952 RepID=Q6CCP8_YARLI|nr:YALI0C07634p [Yarrowia lipolytica CLIB122]AOW02486.1 hypothetical protein YALI1_C10173g [Yarrowia lipolytica]KAB8280349.1 hypothetical protein BKA91DRAFT_142098 [Yarrowia lipolytica]KAE8169431.1 hypothetical protein BKA90DRAFT_142642 [Yarrowia lipolytica]KAJ8053181.1 hypothetical protein LXG23DRAFT_49454 [Yarrowia lipolytica]QNP96481.1 Hypothetical protein YALI2_C00134g [Yarrowia lipolytica]|eukprot:XP_501564.2 YALI0C07634p [Yarrowia lipolytica CLIB122]
MSLKAYFKNVFADNNRAHYTPQQLSKSPRKSEDTLYDYTNPAGDVDSFGRMTQHNEEFNPKFYGNDTPRTNRPFADDDSKKFYPRY